MSALPHSSGILPVLFAVLNCSVRQHIIILSPVLYISFAIMSYPGTFSFSASTYNPLHLIVSNFIYIHGGFKSTFPYLIISLSLNINYYFCPTLMIY